MTKVKICGLRRPCDIEYANILKPEYIGFVFAKSSKRCVTADEAGKLKKALDKNIIAAGVFVNEKPEVIADICGRGIIDIIQLHGNEDEEYIALVRKLTDKKIIKTFKIETKNDIILAEKSSADYVCLDNGKGTGKNFDWSLLEGICRPYFLAGGLDEKNVKEALKKFRPYAVDTSSNVEGSDGYKSFEKMKRFIETVRSSEED